MPQDISTAISSVTVADAKAAMAEKRFDTLYLHIGLGKTGTTSIQSDLLAGAGLLESRYNLHYPRNFAHAEGHGGNHSLLLRVLFSDAPDVRQRLTAMGLPSQQAIDEFNRKTLDELERGFRQTSCTRLLLSAESIGHFRRPQLLQLAQWLRGLAREVRVVVCVRHPLDALSSEIQQRLKIGEVLETMYEKPPVYVFGQLFKRLEEAFGRDSIIAYSFHHAVNSDSGVTAVFLEKIGIAAAEDFPRGTASNPSMSHEGALLFSAFNRLRPILVNGEANPDRLGVDIGIFNRIPGRKFTAPRPVYEAVAPRVQEDVDWLREAYGLDLGDFNVTGQLDYGVFSQRSVDYLALALADHARLSHPVVGKAMKPVARLSLYLYRLLGRLGLGQLVSTKRSPPQ